MMRAKLEAWKKNTLPATVSHVQSVVSRAVRAAIDLSPNDTNKYDRSWIQAGAQTGAMVPMMPAIVASKYNKALMASLVRQADRLDKRREQLQQAYRTRLTDQTAREAQYRIAKKNKVAPARVKRDKMLARLQAQIRTIEQRGQRARQQIDMLERHPSSTVIRRKVAYVLAGNDRHDKRKTHDDGYAIEIEVRDKVYGGEGKIVATMRRVVAMIHLKEPYSQALENKRGIKALAFMSVGNDMQFRLRGRAEFVKAVNKGVPVIGY